MNDGVPPRPPRPFVLETPDPGDPAMAAPVPDPEPQGLALQRAARLTLARSSRLTRFAAWAFGALFSFMLSMSVWQFVTQLLASNRTLGVLGLILLALALFALLLLALREVMGFARLARLDSLRAAIAASADLPAAQRAAARVVALYRGRDDLAWALSRLADRSADVMDADALISLTEREVMAHLDRAAEREIEAAVRQVATVTALVPLALADVATALFANLRMIRRIAEIYGGRSGALGSWRLLRRVFSHLLATGGLALADDLIGSFAGGGLLSKLSRRFGEGVINGALTARVGLAAMELCRPMPFAVLPRPGVTQILRRALSGWIDRDKADSPV